MGCQKKKKKRKDSYLLTCLTTESMLIVDGPSGKTAQAIHREFALVKCIKQRTNGGKKNNNNNNNNNNKTQYAISFVLFSIGIMQSRKRGNQKKKK